MSQTWQDKITQYCDDYNIPLEFLSDTLYEPKVVPMIRGKAFEFNVMLRLHGILDQSVWLVRKEMLNAQLGSNDVDVEIVHLPTGKMISAECKLAKKESVRISPNAGVEIRVKCMRSRTLGASKVKDLAPKYGVTEKSLQIHNDQYLPHDFDIVITSIGNAFYRTNNETHLFEWKPTDSEIKFLENMRTKLDINHSVTLKDLAFNQMYVARSNALTISSGNNLRCTRRSCQSENCGFIPNYPIMKFNEHTLQPEQPWVPLKDIHLVLAEFLSQ